MQESNDNCYIGMRFENPFVQFGIPLGNQITIMRVIDRKMAGVKLGKLIWMWRLQFEGYTFSGIELWVDDTYMRNLIILGG